MRVAASSKLRSNPLTVVPPIATQRKRVKPRTDGRALLFVLACAAPATGGCGPIIEQAAFPARPDTLLPGDLLGPFEGIVVDADNDRPVGGATVAASWAFERGVGLTGPLGTREVVLETGADGRYRIPTLKDLPSGASARVRRFTLIVYHRGHVGWRSDTRFPGGEPRRDFAQRGNRVRLEKWQPAFAHHQHLVFLGGGDAVRAAAAWEVQPASLELEGGGRPGRPGAPGEAQVAGPRALDASVLLSEDEVRGVTGYAGPFELGKLTDLPSTEFYDSRHFKATGKPESHDVALRVWRLGPVGAEAQYRKLLGELPGATTGHEIGDASLRAKTADVTGIAYLLREKGLVVSLICGVAQCTDPAMVLRLAKLVEGHVAELPEVTPEEGAPPAGTQPEAPPPPTPGGPSP